MHQCAPAPRSGRSVVRDRSDNNSHKLTKKRRRRSSLDRPAPGGHRAKSVQASSARARPGGGAAVAGPRPRSARLCHEIPGHTGILIRNFRNSTSRFTRPTDRGPYRYRVLYTQRLTRTKGEETIAPRHARILRRPPPKLASVESRHATPRTCTPLAQGPGPADLWGHADARETPTRRTRQQEHLHSRRPAAGESPPPPGRGVLLSVSLSLCLCLCLSLSDALAITPRWLCHALHRAQSPIRYQYVIVPSHPHPETRCLSRASLHAHSAAAT